MLRLTLVLFIFGEALAEIKISGPCPTPSGLVDFNEYELKGKWYELAKYTKNPGSMSRCVTVDYKLVKDGAIEITNHQTELKSRKSFSFTRTAKPVMKPTNGQYKLSNGAPYNIIAMNHMFWAIAWSCTYADGYSTIFARIMSQSQRPSSLTEEEAYAAAEKFNLHRGDFQKAIKTGCPQSY